LRSAAKRSFTDFESDATANDQVTVDSFSNDVDGDAEQLDGFVLFCLHKKAIKKNFFFLPREPQACVTFPAAHLQPEYVVGLRLSIRISPARDGCAASPAQNVCFACGFCFGFAGILTALLG
jgi:hypothetical protein